MNRKPYNPYTGIVVFCHESIKSKIALFAELDKLLLFDEFIGDVYISHGNVYRKQIERWCQRNQLNLVLGTNYIDTGAKRHLHRLVVYLGFNRNTQEFRLAELKARQLGVDLIILP